MCQKTWCNVIVEWYEPSKMTSKHVAHTELRANKAMIGYILIIHNMDWFNNNCGCFVCIFYI